MNIYSKVNYSSPNGEKTLFADWNPELSKLCYYDQDGTFIFSIDNLLNNYIFDAMYQLYNNENVTEISQEDFFDKKI
jgi:hypothetical protein